ncbi:MAG: BatA domain-containing protein [Acidobacteriota bacterium]
MRFLALTPGQVVLLIGATAAAVIGLYWLRPPFRRLLVPSNLVWVRVLNGQNRRADRLRWWVSLVLAMVIALSIALALGRPKARSASRRTGKVVVVVDTSPTMATRRADGKSRWEHAVERARRLLEEESGSEFLLADTTGQLASFAAFGDRLAALDALEELRVSAAGRPEFPRWLLGEGSGTGIYFISDGVRVDIPAGLPKGTKTISVFEPADNVGITAFDVRSVPADPNSYQAYLEVVNYSLHGKDIDIELSGADRRRSRHRIRLEAGEALGQSLDLSALPSGAVRAAIAADGDALDLDNVAFSDLPRRKRIRVVLVSRGNRYLETSLRLDPRTDLAVWSPAEFSRKGERAVADVLVFDRYAPESPPAVPALLFQPPKVSWLPPRGEEVEGPDTSKWDRSHPLLQFVSLEDLAVERAVRFEAEDAQVVGGSPETPLVLASETPVKWVLVTFDLEDSNFQLQSAFPIFLTNALTWVTEEQAALLKTPGVVVTPLRDARIETLDGTKIHSRPLLGQTAFEAMEPGLYTALAGNKRVHLGVNVNDPTISDVNRTSLARDNEGTSGGRSDGRQRGWPSVEFWVWLLVGALLLAVVEWWFYHRRMTV